MPLLEKLFQLCAHSTTARTEVAVGATTYLTMAYIVFVVPATLSAAGLDKPALIAATCLVTAFSTGLMGFGANVPVAVAPGLTALFSYTLVLTNGVP